MNNIELVECIAKEVSLYKGRIYYVGGYVRDLFLGIPSKDIDVEVYGINEEVFLSILNKYGTVNKVGSSFGVYKLHNRVLDFSFPRKEVKIAEGHKGFSIEVDPYSSFKDACKRRDFTMNAILLDVLTHEVIDPYKGIEAIKEQRISYVNKESFIEDPLRIYRAAVFASRFNFMIDEQTKELCSKMRQEEKSISIERIALELHKVFLKSKHPSIFFHVLKDLHLLECRFPSLSIQEVGVLDKAVSLDSSIVTLDFLWSILIYLECKENMIEKCCRQYFLDKKRIKYCIRLITLSIELCKAVEHKELYETRRVIKRMYKNHIELEELLLFSKLLIYDVEDDLQKSNQGFDLTSLKEDYCCGKELKALGFKEGRIFKEILERIDDEQCKGLSKEEVVKQLEEEVKNERD